MIVSYRDKRTRDFAAGKRVKAFSGIDPAARLKLDRLEAAVELKDLSALPGNRLEAVKGDRKGQYSIRINDQSRRHFAARTEPRDRLHRLVEDLPDVALENGVWHSSPPW